MWMMQKMARGCGYTEADRREINALRMRMLLALVVFLGLNGGHGFVKSHGGNVVNVVVSTVLGLSFMSVLVLAWAIAMRMGDEYRRALMGKSLVWGTAATMALASVWGYLEIDVPGMPHLPLIMLPVALAMVTALTKIVVFRRAGENGLG